MLAWAALYPREAKRLTRAPGWDGVQVLARKAVGNDEAAVLALLRQHDGLEVEFHAPEFAVVAQDRRVLACGRLKRHADGALELASVATDRDAQGQGFASVVVRRLLAGVAEPVYALALAPGFFARHGFREVPKESLPASVRAKAEGMCASRPFVAMRR